MIVKCVWQLIAFPSTRGWINAIQLRQSNYMYEGEVDRYEFISDNDKQNKREKWDCQAALFEGLDYLFAENNFYSGVSDDALSLS